MQLVGGVLVGTEGLGVEEDEADGFQMDGCGQELGCGRECDLGGFGYGVSVGSG